MTRHARTAGSSIGSRCLDIGTLGIVLVCAGLLAPATVAAENAGQLLIPPDEIPTALAELRSLDIARGFAMSPDGQRAAIGVPDPLKPKGGYVRFTADDGASPADVAVKGHVLQLCFDPSAPFIYALAQRVGRKGVLEAFVARVDPSTKSADRLVTLPASASDLSMWNRRPALLVASENEVRSILLPVGRSGPLYQVPGDNRAVAALPGSDRLLVGQDLQILMIDLSDPQGPEAMPIREKLEIPAPVARMLPSPAGDAALVRLDDGRVFTLRLDPMRLEDERSADWIAWMGEPVAYEPAAPVTAAPMAVEVPEPVEPAAAREPPEPAPAPEPEVVEQTAPAGAAAVAVMEAAELPEEEPSPVAEPPVPEPAPVEVEKTLPEEPIVEPEPEATVDTPTSVSPDPPPAVPDPQPAVTPAAAPVPETTPPTAPAAPSTAEPETSKTTVSADPSKGDAEGKLSGPALSEVVAVVLHGPNNIMREAARVRPESDGTWSAFGLEPGRYRVILDGGGGRVLQTQPSFRTIDVKAGSRVTVEAINVSGTL